MDEKQILELIKSTLAEQLPVVLDKQLPSVLKGAFSEFQNHFEERLSGLQQTQENNTDLDESDPVAKRLKLLEAKLQESEAREQQRQQEASQLRFSNTLGSALAGKGNILHQKLVAELLENRLRNGAVEKDGQWFTRDGLKLAEAVESFFGSDEGLHFLPSNHQNGTATPAARQPQSFASNTKDVSVDDMLSDTVW